MSEVSLEERLMATWAHTNGVRINPDGPEAVERIEQLEYDLTITIDALALAKERILDLEEDKSRLEEDLEMAKKRISEIEDACWDGCDLCTVPKLANNLLKDLT